MKKKLIKISRIREEHDMLHGIRNSIGQRLSVSHSSAFTKEIMDKVDLIIEISTEMGIDIAKHGFDGVVKTNLYRAKQSRRE